MKRLPILVMLVAAVALPAFATNGYFTHGTGTVNKAMAGAGIAAPFEALDTASNPAAAAFLDRGYQATFALFSPDRSYTVKGNPSGYPGTFGLAPGTVTSKSTMFPMPSFAANYRPNDATGLGFSLVARGGMDTNYHTSTFYGPGNTGIDLGQMFLNATYAKKLSEHHALGITAIGVAQRFKAFGLEAFSQMSHDPVNLTGNGYSWSYGAGVQLGYLGRISDTVSVGASWTPQIRMSRFEKYDGLFADHGSFDIPSAVTAGLAWKPNDEVTLAADFQRIHYSDVRSVGSHLFPNLMAAPLGMESGSGFGWDDVDVVKVGGSWQATPDWRFSAGYSKANDPIPSSEMLFNILAPGVIEQHYTFGVSRSLPQRPGRMSVAVMYAPTKKISGPNMLEAPGQQEIELQMNEWEVEFGYSF